MKTKPAPYLFLILAIALLAFGYGLWTNHNVARPRTPIGDPLELASATRLPLPQDIQPFHLTDKNNQIFNLKNLKNHWSFVFFGFTHCQMVCPTALSNLKEMQQQLQHNHINPLPQIVFISVDPENDTASQLSEYLQSFDVRFEGASGDKQQLDALTKQFNVVYSKVYPQGTDHDYSIEHSGTIFLVNPKGELYAVFTAPHDPKKMADDFAKMAKNYN